MRLLALIPLAFLSGVDGFAIFAPYLGVMLILLHLRQRRRRRLMDSGV